MQCINGRAPRQAPLIWKGKNMDTRNRSLIPGRQSQERISALAVAVAATLLVFAAINAGFTPHAAELTRQAVSQPGLSL